MRSSRVSPAIKIMVILLIGSFILTGCSSKDYMNHPPKGFQSLFNGKDLTGWHRHEGLPGHGVAGRWTVEDGDIVGVQDPPGSGGFLTTLEKYRDFELQLEAKIDWPFDSGIFLRTGPDGKSHQMTLDYREGGEIGGIYCPWTTNFVHHCPEGINHFKKDEWNRIRIICQGEPARIRVWVNETLITDFQHTDKTTAGVPGEGTLSLQIHPGGEGHENSKARFRNIYLREIPRDQALFNGRDLTGWQMIGGSAESWKVQDGVLYTEGIGGGWLSTTQEFADFQLELEFRVPPGGNSGVFLRSPHEGNPAYAGMEIQVLDDYDPQYDNLKPWQFTGSIYGVQAPSKRISKKADQWQKMMIICRGPKVQVTLNGTRIIDADLNDHKDKLQEHPGLIKPQGYIGLQVHSSRLEYRNIKIKELL